MADQIGLTLSGDFYAQIVAPILAQVAPGLPLAVARLGRGSEVLGYDDHLSADHDYGPSLQVFLRQQDFADHAPKLMQALDQHLPDSFAGWPIRFPANTRPDTPPRLPGMLWSSHGVELYTVDQWCLRFLQRRFAEDWTVMDWLSYPEQLFLMITAGRVFRDDFHELEDLRQRAAYYPQDVWLFRLAAEWGCIAEERANVGRAGIAGDELGSAVIAARMVSHLMRLTLLIERRYAPYPKWLGKAFAPTETAGKLGAILGHVLAATDWQARERHLVDACQLLADAQLARGIPGAVPAAMGDLHGRPFRFIDTLAMSQALHAAIKDDDLRKLNPIGGPDQYLSANYLLASPALCQSAAQTLLSAPIMPDLAD